VHIEEGHFPKHGIHSSKMHVSPASSSEQTHLQQLDSPEQRLACVTEVHGDLLVFVPDESRGQKQIIRKSITERTIAVKPAVRQVFVEVDGAQLGQYQSDWGRLEAALADQWDLVDLTIDLPALRRLQETLRQGQWKVTVILWQEQQVIDVQAGYQEGVYGLAVDVGSTTIAGYLCDLRTGETLATESMMNPQVTYGEDLMSRISYAATHSGGLEKMHRAIVDALNKLLAGFRRRANVPARHIHEAVFVGNTTMMHILLGINPKELGNAPFTLAYRRAMDLKARELGLRMHPGANIHILPAQAGHVGADNTGVIVAEEPHRQEGIILTVDIGTNAEIVLSNRKQLYSASSPTGPAFEGAQISSGMRAAPGAIERVRIDPESKVPHFRVIGEMHWSDQWQSGADIAPDRQPRHLAAGICGSGIIEAVAQMYLTGIILANGRFNSEFKNHERLVQDGRKMAYILATDSQTATGQPILVTQEDVRNVQLAKAALYAGTKLLMNKAGVGRVDRIVLAGAFGSYIDPKHAMILGLIPDCALENVYSVGNAAGDGARIALLNRARRKEAQEIADRVQYVETALASDFQDEFISALHLPHASDPFPHLAGELPRPSEAAPSRSRRARDKPA
jgi:uncharacterized 2Fe-2S/4Fe-4S cluster protein (DUF4445 family)